MKNIKTFESFVNEKKVSYYVADLVDMLSNSDAMELTADEFMDYCVDEFDMAPGDALEIHDAYWSLGAKDRFHFDEDKWIKWLNKLGIK